MPTVLFTPPSTPHSHSPRFRTPSPGSPGSPTSPILLTPRTPPSPSLSSVLGAWTPTKMSHTDAALSTSRTTARSHHTTPSGGSPILRSAPLVNPATANIILPDIILNSPPVSRRGSHVDGIAEAAASVGSGVLHGLGLSVATLPSLAQFKWARNARMYKDKEMEDEAEGSEAGVGDEEWNVEGRRSRSTSPKYILPSYIPNQPYPLHGPNNGLSTSHHHIAATASSSTGSHKAKSKKSYKANSKHTKHRAHWGRPLRNYDDEEEPGAWWIIFMMVVVVMTLAYLSSLLSGQGGEYDMGAGRTGQDKVIGWGKADGPRRWHVKRASEALKRVNTAHALDWEDSLHHESHHGTARFDGNLRLRGRRTL